MGARDLGPAPRQPNVEVSRRSSFRAFLTPGTVENRPVAPTSAISVRLDDEAERALRTLEATGMSRSEAIRTSLVRAARATRRHEEIAAEVAALESDDADRSEMFAVAEMMESLRAPG